MNKYKFKLNSKKAKNNKVNSYLLNNTIGRYSYRNRIRIGKSKDEVVGGSIIYRGYGLETETKPIASIQVKTGESYALPTGSAGRRKKNKFDF